MASFFLLTVCFIQLCKLKEVDMERKTQSVTTTSSQVIASTVVDQKTLQNLTTLNVDDKIKVGEDEIQRILKDPETYAKDLQETIAADVAIMRSKTIQIAGKESEALQRNLDELLTTLDNIKHSNDPWFKQAFRKWFGVFKKTVEGPASPQEIVEKIKEDLLLHRKNVEEVTIDLIQFVENAKIADQKLEKSIHALTIAEQRASQVLENIPKDSPQRMIAESKLHAIRTRLQDLHTTKGVVNQAELTALQIIETNRKLIDAVDRTLHVGMIALQVSLAITASLDQQQKAIEAVAATREFTNRLIENNARLLKEQTRKTGELYKQAPVDPKRLEKALKDIVSAQEQLKKIKKEALQLSKQNIEILETLGKKIDHYKGPMRESVLGNNDEITME